MSRNQPIQRPTTSKPKPLPTPTRNRLVRSGYHPKPTPTPTRNNR